MIWTQLAGVATVFALLAAVGWWLRRGGALSRRTPAGGRPPAERLGRLRLGPAHSLELVRLADRVLVIAVHGSGCSLVDSLAWRDYASACASPHPEAGQ